MNIKIIKEEDVTTQAMVDLFKSAFFKVSEVDEKNTFRVEMGTVPIYIQVNEEDKTILFYYVEMIEKESYEELCKKVNEQNNRNSFVRFYIEKDEDENLCYIITDYTMSYEIGIIPFQIVNMAKSFESTTVAGGREILGL